MPRGIPNLKRDDLAFRYTTFNVPLIANPKHMSTTYLKSETQTLWSRNSKKKSSEETESQIEVPRRGTNVIVLHPGSRFLRIGKAVDVSPITVPCVVSRKCAAPVPSVNRIKAVIQPEANENDSYDDNFNEKLSAVTLSLRDRMRFYKLRVTANATEIATTFNKQFQPEVIPEYNDSHCIEWMGNSLPEDTYVGDQALYFSDPGRTGYVVRWPIYGASFNMREYSSIQVALSDIELLIQVTLKDRFNIGTKEYKDYSVIIVIPDCYERAYVRELVSLLLVNMGFRQICAQQESLAASYGAGVSNACVVNIGATRTNVSCVDEGAVIADTRLSLNIGGDDITEFLYVLLRRIHFPYRDLDLARAYDWNVMEDLKIRLCTLSEADVGLNLYDFVVRRPDRPTEKYGLRAYDEFILAPMCLFEPRVIEFDKKRVPKFSLNVTEEILEHRADLVTNAMIISTEHLIPASIAETSNLVDQSDLADGEPSTIALPSTTIASQNASGLNSSSDFQSECVVDICFEASKLPLDVAIFNSTRAAGGDDKIRKYLQAVVIVGGTARLPGMAHALESRLQAIATPLVQNMEKVQILPSPKEVDPSVLVWKGAAVLGKMDGVSDLWVTQNDWDTFGMRALKERCFFLS